MNSCTSCGQAAAFHCHCNNPPVHLCTSCLIQHLVTPQRQPHEPRPVLQSVEMNQESMVCSECRANTIAKFCGCRDEKILLCEKCELRHVEREPGKTHYILPVKYMPEVKSKKQAKRICLKIQQQKNVIEMLKKRVEECAQALSARFKSFENEYRENSLKLQALSQAMTDALSQDDSSNVQSVGQIEALIQKGDLQAIFKCDITAPRISFLEVMGVDWSSTVSIEPTGRDAMVQRELDPQMELLRDNFEYKLKALEERLQNQIEDKDKAIVDLEHRLLEIGAKAESVKLELQESMHDFEAKSEIDSKPMRDTVEYFRNCILLSASGTPALRAIFELEAEMRIPMLFTALHRHKVNADLAQNFQRYLVDRMQEAELQNLLLPFFIHFSECLAETPSAASQHHAEAILQHLMNQGMTLRIAEDWTSLFHVLTRQERLPFDLASLAAYCDIRPRSKVAILKRDHIRLYDCVTESWGAKIMLSGVVHHSIGLYHQCNIFLPNGNIFTCGGENPFVSDTYEIDVNSGEIRKLADMLCKCCGSCLIMYFNWVYCFGGYNNSNIAIAEKYSIAENKWVKLKNDMITARHCTTPCLYKHKIYLCGGWSCDKSELFDPISETFSLLSFTLPEQSHTRARIIGEEIFVIQSQHIMKVNLNSRSTPHVINHTKYNVGGCMSGCEIGSFVWYTDLFGEFNKMETETGNLIKSISIPD